MSAEQCNEDEMVALSEEHYKKLKEFYKVWSPVVKNFATHQKEWNYIFKFLPDCLKEKEDAYYMIRTMFFSTTEEITSTLFDESNCLPPMVVQINQCNHSGVSSVTHTPDCMFDEENASKTCQKTCPLRGHSKYCVIILKTGEYTCTDGCHLKK